VSEIRCRLETEWKKGTQMRRCLFSLLVLLTASCAAIPVQETTLRNSNGGTVTCKQVGRGVVSYGIGKHLYDDCIAKAHADGLTVTSRSD
jgi:hypothetical protein